MPHMHCGAVQWLLQLRRAGHWHQAFSRHFGLPLPAALEWVEQHLLYNAVLFLRQFVS